MLDAGRHHAEVSSRFMPEATMSGPNAAFDQKGGIVIDNPIRGRFNAWFFQALDGYMHGKYCEIKSRLLQQVPATVVELGPGSGANFRYLPHGIRLIAIEPNVHMHPALRRRAAERGIELDLRGLRGEELDIQTGSVDFVFSSLVLCSVDRPEQVITEVRRILKPGGRFACVEHVVAPEGSNIHAIQRLLRRPWKWLFEGCELCRDTGATLRSSGFSRVDVQPLVLPTIFVPIRHQIAAMCVN
jgi:SAM-dependent methyltransferase